MGAYYVIRDGAVKLRLPEATVEPDGAVSVMGAYVIDGELARAEGRLDEVARLAKAKRWDKIDRRYLAKVGTSASGLRIISQADYDAEQWRQRRAHLDAHPEISERAEIESMLEQAARLIEDTEYDRGYNLRHQAELRLAAWREKYPVAAAEEDARHLEAKAEHLRELAVGALVYDADGWITFEIRQARHDKMMAEAAELDRQAAEIRSKT